MTYTTTHVISVVTAVAVSVLPFAQTGLAENSHATSDRFFRVLDQDCSGRIEPCEWDRIRTLRDWLTARQVDISRPMPPSEFEPLYVEFVRELRNAHTRRHKPGMPTVVLENQAVAGAGARTNKTPVRVSRASVPLPYQFRALDQNADGQIGLYEWPLADLETFVGLDKNNDGFLIPLELSGIRSRAARAPKSDREVRQQIAGLSFRRLDVDGDGTLSAVELERSAIIRSSFEQNGLPIPSRMTRQQFIDRYKQLTISEESEKRE